MNNIRAATIFLIVVLMAHSSSGSRGPQWVRIGEDSPLEREALTWLLDYRIQRELGNKETEKDRQDHFAYMNRHLTLGRQNFWSSMREQLRNGRPELDKWADTGMALWLIKEFPFLRDRYRYWEQSHKN